MRFDAAFSHLLLSAAAIAAASAAEHKEHNAPPTRKRSLRTAAATAQDAEASLLRAPADAPVAATAVGGGAAADNRGIMIPQEEEDIRLLRLDDAKYWKNFLGGDEGSMPDNGCNFDVDINCEVKFAGGKFYRDCDDAFVCTRDMTEQKFLYIGGGCNSDAAGARNYECRTYNNGPTATETVRILVVYGDWWDAITSGAAATYKKTKERLNDLTDGRLNVIEILDKPGVKPKNTFDLTDLGDPLGAPSDVDTDDFTYIVFENNGDNGKLLLKATWQWKCTGSNSGRYAIFDNFGSSELIGIESDSYGYAQASENNPPAQMKLTTTLKNECHGSEGMVAHLDRRFCYRDVGDAGYTCNPLPQYGPPTSQGAKLCVDQGQFATDAQCVADGPLANEGTQMVPLVIKQGGDITFTDTMFTTLEIMEGREFQYRVPNATVYFKNGDGEYVSNLNNREEWFFGEGTPTPPTPAPGDCDFDVSNIQCQVTFNNNIAFRQCEDAWKCTSDMVNQRFLYLGGGCKSEDFGNDVRYGCRTYGGGPGDSTRRVEIYQGDWYGIIEDNDSVNQVRNKITAQLTNNCNFGNVRILDKGGVNAGDTLSPSNFRGAQCGLSAGDAQFLTYVVYQNDGNFNNADVRMKARWKWDCAPSDNEFFPMEAEYSVYDNFGNAELTRFVSSTFGTVEKRMQTLPAQFTYTFKNKCNAEGRIQNLDRELCARDCGDSKDEDWSCPEASRKDGCVMNGSTMAPCAGRPNTVLPPNGSTMILDTYNIPVGPTYEFQLRLLDTRVKWGNDMVKTKPREEEVFEFCANDSTTGSGGSGTGGGGSAGGGDGGGSGGGGGGGSANKSNKRRALADSRGKLVVDTSARTNRKQARREGARRNDWESDQFF